MLVSYCFLTNDHRLTGLKQHKCILQLWRSEVRVALQVAFLLGRICFVVAFWCLLHPFVWGAFSILKASHSDLCSHHHISSASDPSSSLPVTVLGPRLHLKIFPSSHLQSPFAVYGNIFTGPGDPHREISGELYLGVTQMEFLCLIFKNNT